MRAGGGHSGRRALPDSTSVVGRLLVCPVGPADVLARPRRSRRREVRPVVVIQRRASDRRSGDQSSPPRSRSHRARSARSSRGPDAREGALPRGGRRRLRGRGGPGSGAWSVLTQMGLEPPRSAQEPYVRWCGRAAAAIVVAAAYPIGPVYGVITSPCRKAAISATMVSLAREIKLCSPRGMATSRHLGTAPQAAVIPSMGTFVSFCP